MDEQVFGMALAKKYNSNNIIFSDYEFKYHCACKASA